MIDRLREWWERLAPRERKLMSALGVTAVLCVFGFIGFMINDGLDSLAAKNAAARQALGDLGEHRDELVAGDKAKVEPGAAIADEAPSLATYLEGIETEVGVKIRNSSEKPTLTKGKFHEKSVQVTLYGVTLAELADFLRRIETKTPGVVTQKLTIKRSSTQPESLDRVEITVATYERAKPKGSDAKDKEKDKTPGKDGGAEGVTP
jgi:type II secretory pathway component PulM